MDRCITETLSSLRLVGGYPSFQWSRWIVTGFTGEVCRVLVSSFFHFAISVWELVVRGRNGSRCHGEIAVLQDMVWLPLVELYICWSVPELKYSNNIHAPYQIGGGVYVIRQPVFAFDCLSHVSVCSMNKEMGQSAFYAFYTQLLSLRTENMT